MVRRDRMIFHSNSRYKEYLEMMEGEIEKLESGDLGRLRSVYGAFATQDYQLTGRRCPRTGYKRCSPGKLVGIY